VRDRLVHRLAHRLVHRLARRLATARGTATATGGLVAATLVAQAALAPASSAATEAGTGLPGGRPTYVVSVMDGKAGALAVRLATYEFSTSGTVTEKYWAWSQNSISGTGNARWTKAASGYRTTGCRYACPVRTPYGFQKGAAPHSFTGRWSMESPTVLAIRWAPSYPVERWRLDTSKAGIVGLKLLSARNGGRGWGVGSRASARTGVPLSRVYASRWITGPFAENAYSPTTKDSWIGWSAQDYKLCSTGTCMQGTKMTAANRNAWYHSYFAANPASDGRKVFWNNQTGVVQHLESANSPCISSGGGHTNALLQALDDNGQFVGFVGVEASLNSRKYGQAVVAAYAMLSPSLLPAIGASA
jgi:hypothetical protein